MPTLVRVVDVVVGCVVVWRLVVYFGPKPERGGGGSSKFGKLEAFGLRAVKLLGAPIESGPP